MPTAYSDVFSALGRQGVIPMTLASGSGAAAAFRNLVAHQYGILDCRRVHGLTGARLEDLEAFCAIIADRIGDIG
jgi:uncharacterized protein YutE (UPF0331/DUF86 family)